MAGLAATFGRGAMTNHWIDVKNANCIFIIGANPCENHPGVMRWINQAIDNGAKVVVADPRKTRTATLADIHLQIRPGTDIALIYGMLNHLLFDSPAGVTGDQATRANIEAFLATTGTSRNFKADDGGTGASGTGWPKYADALFKVNSAGDDYDRETKTWSSKSVSNVPKLAGGPISTAARLSNVVTITTANSTPHGLQVGDSVVINGVNLTSFNGTFTVASAPSSTTFTYSQTASDESGTGGTAYGAGSVYQKLRSWLAEYTPAVAADICGVAEADIKAAAVMIAQNSTPAIRSNGSSPKAATLLYAMGATQHTYGSQIIRSYAVFQTMLGNMGKFGGGINAMRGIHNVQGSTDMGLLYGNIPGYSGPPATNFTGNKGFVKYQNTKMFGNPYGTTITTVDAAATDTTITVANTSNGISFVAADSLEIMHTNGTTSETVTVASIVGSVVTLTTGLANAYTAGATVVNSTYATRSTATPFGLQQRGFNNMLRYWFSDGSSPGVGDSAASLFDYFPKGNGQNHVQMFKDMISGATTMAVVWGQNPAVTEPNLTEVRSGLTTVPTLVVVDQFFTETAGLAENKEGPPWYEGRAGTGKTTYVLPACSFAEKAGSQTNSGRWIQWRSAAIPSMGGSRADMEILLNLAKALGTAGAFDHITGGTYTALYGNQYGYTTWLTKDATYMSALDTVAESVYIQFAQPLNAGGTLWIYSNAAGASGLRAGYQGGVNYAKSRVTTDTGGMGVYPDWGHAWLLNRRIFYNNGETTFAGDQSDTYVNADIVAQLFTGTVTKYGQHAYAYRYYRAMTETDTNKTVNEVKGGRFPKHWEPMESSRSDLVANTAYGRNENATNVPDTYATRGGGATAADRAHQYVASGYTTYPLVLTTIRCTEHFQGGPTTRNVPWLNELVPVPWIEINAYDAKTYRVKNGDYVRIQTDRGTTDNANGNFKVVVTTNRVKQGVVAIPWHWGNQGLSKGPSANDVTIPAGDANTTIPEYKACLCTLIKQV